MALAVNDNGTYVVKTKQDAAKALKMMHERQQEIQELMQEHGITELMTQATELKRAATSYCIRKKIAKLDLGDQYAALREDGYDRRWIGTKKELAELGNPPGVVSLYSILSKKRAKSKKFPFRDVWMRITKRVVDADALQEVIDEGILDEDEISAAFVEKKKAPYLRLYSKGDDDGAG